MVLIYIYCCLVKNNKFGFTFIQILTFVKERHELSTELDKWSYEIKRFCKTFYRRFE